MNSKRLVRKGIKVIRKNKILDKLKKAIPGGYKNLLSEPEDIKRVILGF